MSNELEFFMYKDRYEIKLFALTHYHCTLEEIVLKFATYGYPDDSGERSIWHEGIIYRTFPNEKKSPKMITQKERQKVYKEAKERGVV